MANLSRASKQLFSRPEDERFETFEHLLTACRTRREESTERWKLPGEITPTAADGALCLETGDGDPFLLNDWSFTQTCSLASVHKETINRLSTGTAASALRETFPGGKKPMQLLTRGQSVRSVHGASYTRLYDVDLLEMVQNTADGFTPPPKGFNGATGLYSGEQDTFAFLIDDSAWVDIAGEEFAPGFFVWNSEVGRRTVGIETFWYQRICANHIVWDATEVVTYSRKHTAKVDDALEEIQMLLKQLVETRNRRRDGFARTIEAAMTTSLGTDASEVSKVLSSKGIPAGYAKQAIKDAENAGKPFTVFEMVDSLTRMTGRLQYAGDRSDQDRKIGQLLSLAS